MGVQKVQALLLLLDDQLQASRVWLPLCSGE